MMVSARTIAKLQRDLPGSEHRQVRLEGFLDMRLSGAWMACSVYCDVPLGKGLDLECSGND